KFLFPFIIMFSLPATVIGVVGGLLISGLSFSIVAFIGIIMLEGIVVNNSIDFVDYIDLLYNRGKERYEYIIKIEETLESCDLVNSKLYISIPYYISINILTGIVINISIVLVKYIDILRERGMERYEAIIEAGRTRLRPILMTTLTTVLAMVPLGLALGEGAEMQQPLAVTIIFGLSISSIFTLLLIPVVYTFFD